ncbi:MAG TPA: NAD(P)-dependent alcohol dehydrogenase [Candidatus Brocadiia bacterium]|nr:NAD(P)-dependent alcohol dehydrogenase [Candidatus Brocadiia bacterium]
MAKTIKAAVLVKAGKITYEDRPRPKPKAGEVLIAPEFCGVCGSDVHYYYEGRIADFVVEQPLVLGHEFAGRIVAIGRDVVNLKVGQKVAVEPGVPCRKCPLCKKGRYNLCPFVRFAGTPPADGAFAELVTYPADFCYPLPDGVTTEDGALAEPLTCGIHTVERARIQVGETVAILGDGPIGLATLLAAQAAGGRVVLLTGIVPERMRIAREMGAENVLHATKDDVIGFSKNVEIDVAIDCAGAVSTPQTCIDIARIGGRMAIIGFAGVSSLPLNIPRAVAKELDIMTVMRYANNFPAAMELLRQKLPLARRLITHRFGFDQIEEAFDVVHNLKDGVIKAMICFDK